jgi:transposase
MLQISPQQNIFLAVNPIDFRAGIETLKAKCRQILQLDPFSGSLFVFTNKRRIAVKILMYDGNGFWLCTKRFSEGKLRWWPSEAAITTIRSSELAVLLAQGIPDKANIPQYWRTPMLPQVPQVLPRNSMVATV